MGNAAHVQYLLTLLSLSMSDWVAFPFEIKWGSLGLIIPIIYQVITSIIYIFGTFVIMFHQELYFGLNYSGDVDLGSILLMITFLSSAVVYSLYTIPWRRKDGQYVLAWKLVTEYMEILGIKTVGPVSPAYLNLSDGGHFGNQLEILVFFSKTKYNINTFFFLKIIWDWFNY